MDRWRYSEVASVARRFARELEQRGIGKGDRVLLWGESSAEWVAAFWGCVLRGAIIVPMDRVAAPDFARRVAEEVSPRLAVIDSELRQHLDVPAISMERLREEIAGHSDAPLPFPELAPTETLQVVFTSGTTAEPKGVVITHRNVLANLEPIEREMQKYLKYERIFHPIRFLNLLPLSHVFGQFLALFLPPLMGGTVVFHDTLNPTELLRTIKRERVSVLVTVPRMLDSLRDKLERELEAENRLERFRRDFVAARDEKILKRWWRFRRVHRKFGWKFWAVISGGAALSPEAEDFWNRLGYGVIQGYGLTETTSLISVNHPFKLGRGSIGKVLPGRDMKLDPETGEILVRGESIASGYWQGKELKPVASEEGGWFRTGDIGELDAAGNLYFKGRKKNVIVTPAGLNVYPEDLERALRAQPEVRDCVVVGLAQGGNAEPCAVLLLRHATDDPGRAVQSANETLAEFQRMRHWYVWPEQDFPRTSTQKPRTAAIAERVNRELRGDKGAAATVEDDVITQLIAQVTGRVPQKTAPGAALEAELNLSSIDKVELMSALEDRFQLDLNDATFAEARTVGDLRRMLEQPAAAASTAAAAGAKTRFTYWRWPQRWPMTWIRPVVYYLLAWPATMIMAMPRVSGRERLRDLRRPVLFVSNHVTMNDIGFILAALPHRLRRMSIAMQGEMLQEMRYPPRAWPALARLGNWASYWLITALFNVFPLPQRAGYREAFAFAGESADRGYSLLIFPEGRRTPDGTLQPFRSGIGILAQQLKLPVVTLRIHGQWEAKQKNRLFLPPGMIKVSIGEPVRYAPEATAEEITRDLERRVRDL